MINGAGCRQGNLITAIDTGLKDLKKSPNKLNNRFDRSSSLPTDSIFRDFWRAFYNPKSIKPNVTAELDPLHILQQRTNADCVGAVSMSVISAVAGVPVSDSMYDRFLEACLRNEFAEEKPEGVQVSPFVLNLLVLPVVQEALSVQARVSYRNGLTLSEIHEISERAKKSERPYQHFALTPVASWFNLGGGHLVALQELSSADISIYDPNYLNRRQLAVGEFVRHWAYGDNAAIMIFAR